MENYYFFNISHLIGVLVSNYKLVYLKVVTSNGPVWQVRKKAHKHHEKDNRNEFGTGSGRFEFKCVVSQEGSIINNIIISAERLMNAILKKTFFKISKLEIRVWYEPNKVAKTIFLSHYFIRIIIRTWFLDLLQNPIFLLPHCCKIFQK